MQPNRLGFQGRHYRTEMQALVLLSLRRTD